MQREQGAVRRGERIGGSFIWRAIFGANDIVVLRGRFMSGQRDCSPCILIIGAFRSDWPRHGCANKQNDYGTSRSIMPATMPRRCAMALNKCWMYSRWQQYPLRTHFNKVAVSGLHFTRPCCRLAEGSDTIMARAVEIRREIRISSLPLVFNSMGQKHPGRPSFT